MLYHAHSDGCFNSNRINMRGAAGTSEMETEGMLLHFLLFFMAIPLVPIKCYS